MTTTASTDGLLDAWRKARNEADEFHRRALDDADKIYQLWLTAQKESATRGALLSTATWEDRLAAIQALAPAELHMRKPGDWYVSQPAVSVSDGAILRGEYGNGPTPEAAVEEHWRILTGVDGDRWLAVRENGERINALWDGDTWKTWTAPSA